MDPEKLVKLQMQMQQNNEDYKTFLDGMESWSSEMKVKENKLKNVSNTNNNNAHRIRNITQKEIINKKPKIKAYDYRSWDKFDVDKALEECDKEEPLPKDDTYTMSENHKEMGNLYFKQCNYEKAINEYSSAITHCPDNDILYSNRAMSYIKLKRYSEAEIDCSTAIGLNPNSIKAYYRRSQCLVFLNRKEEALADLKTILKLDPDNELSKRDMRELERELNVRGLVQPLSQPAKNRQSNNKLIRIDIHDVNPKILFPTISTNKINQESQLNLPQIEEIKKPETQEVPINTNDTVKFRFPQTAVQLERDLTQFRSSRSHYTGYINVLRFDKLRQVIGHALDSDLLELIVTGLCFALQDNVINETRFLEAMLMLGRIERFSFSWMMLASEPLRLFQLSIASFSDTTRTQLPSCCIDIR